MNHNLSLSMGQIQPMGVTIFENHMNIAVSFPRRPLRECGISLFSENKRVCRIVFEEAYKTGLLYTVRIEGVFPENLKYQFFFDDEIWIDPYAKRIVGREKWAKNTTKRDELKAVAFDMREQYDWEQDKNPCIPYENSILYSLHVRGYTKHASSKVNHRGTYEGLCEKIPYLKELGITAVLCMPFYEFDEIIRNPAYQENTTALQEYLPVEQKEWKYRINYWGFGDAGNFYMAPKASYAANPQESITLVKDMVKRMHQNGIEVLMQIYFPHHTSAGFIREILQFWVVHYHIDGFQLLGVDLPVALLANDPVLGNTKLIVENTMGAGAESFVNDGYMRNLAGYKDDFRCDVRKYLKGDENMLYSISREMRENSEQEAIIHHVTDYRGFTLHDLVSYDYKHNEENGEENRDGSDYNYSWNCGVEGKSRKKGVLSLRLSQSKNAMCMLLLGQATPLILAGDELGHSAGGNNNAYCQDNKTNWINWEMDDYQRQLFAFVKKCISFRMKHPILHRKLPMRLMDTISCGYPDISYHGEQAWYTRFENYNRHLGIMLCGLYEPVDFSSASLKQSEQTDDFIYLAMNMHWNTHEFALPQLPEDRLWHMVLQTREQPGKDANAEQGDVEDEQLNNSMIALPPRSICVLVGTKRVKPDKKTRQKTNKIKNSREDHETIPEAIKQDDKKETVVSLSDRSDNAERVG